MIAYLDCSTGVSGDKFLGALLDVGAQTGRFTPEMLCDAVASVAPEAEVTVEAVRSHGIAARAVRVTAAGQPSHRHWSDLRETLASASLPDAVRERAIAAFSVLAEAEAWAHGTSADEVHFHEVGAVDSIADVVGVCAGVHALGITELTASPVAVGGGTISIAHGLVGVPAPAVARLLIGVPIVPGPSSTELTTPTGAALLHACSATYGPCPPMTPRAVGHGAGTRDIGAPNVCRLVLGEPTPAFGMRRESVVLLETNIDHITPEACAFAAEQLLAEGALDTWLAPITMKKGRAAILLSVLTQPEAAEATAARIAALTGSLGVRSRPLDRFVAERESVVRATAYGPIRFKVGPTGARPEADDVARVASETSRSFSAVHEELTALF